jgi:uncharacterized integral membrane protein (TIGR00697 family)
MKTSKMDFLVALYIFCVMVAELMGSKTFPLLSIGSFHLNASVAIFVLPLIFTINDVITEVYGKERARGVVRLGLLMIAGVMVTCVLFTMLPPSARFMSSEAAYDLVFGKSARIAAASLTAFALAEFADVYVFYRIRQKLGTSKLWLRNNVSNFVSQFIDTTFFISLAFYSFNLPVAVNLSFLVSLIIPYWLLKCTISVLETPFVYWGVRWLKGEKVAT